MIPELTGAALAIDALAASVRPALDEAADPELALVAALAAVQTELPRIVQDRTANVETRSGGSYSYTYANLATISAAVLPLLGRHGLAFIAIPTFTDNGAAYELRYSLRHVAGARIEGVYPLPDPWKSTPQELGSAITYGRRYTLCSVTGVAPDKDDDDAAEVSHRRPSSSPEVRITKARPTSDVRPRLAPGTQQNTDPWPDDAQPREPLHRPGSGTIPDVTGTAPERDDAPTLPRPRSEAQKANDRVRGATPPELRDEKGLDDDEKARRKAARGALRSLAAGWGATTTALAGKTLNDYSKFARLVAKGDATIEHDNGPPAMIHLLGVDGATIAAVRDDIGHGADAVDYADEEARSPGSAGPSEGTP